jgi:hypothetical protein
VRRTVVPAIVALTLALGACSSDSDSDPDDASPASSTTTVAAKPAQPLVFNGQGNDLAAYLAEPPFTKQIVIPHYDEATKPDGLDINGEICFDPQRPNRFVAGEDTLQTSTGKPGWGIFELSGTEIGKLSARQLGKLVPTYQASEDNAENYGCGFLADGRIVTTDIGNQAEGDGDGQLIVWFPPFESRDVKYCKLDIDIATAQGVLVDGDAVYVASARPPTAGIWRYDASTFPTSNTAEGGCDGKDGTGAPFATQIQPQLFIKAENSVATPNDIAKAPDGRLYVSSVFTGTIAEFTADGKYVRDVLKPPAGEALGAKPFSTGTPLGVGVGSDGSVYYADIGIVVSERGIGPGRGTGHVRRIAFDSSGKPQAPEVMDQGLAFPDGIGIFG